MYRRKGNIIYFKNIFSIILACCLIQFNVIAEELNISATVVGKEFYHISEEVEDKTILIPFRELFEKLGYKIQFNEKTNEVIASNDNDSYQFNLNSTRVIYKYGTTTKSKNIDVLPQNVDDKLYVSKKILTFNQDLKIDFDEEGLLFSVRAIDNDELLEQETNSTIIVVNEDVLYSFKDDDLNQICKYITDTIDPFFDIKNFEVTRLTTAVDDNDTVISGAITLDFKMGDFISDDNYYITITDDKIEKIYITGTPFCNRNNVLTNIKEIDEKSLKKMALDYIEIDKDNYSIVGQQIDKRYDYEPYYNVITEVRTKDKQYGYLELFEYRF